MIRLTKEKLIDCLKHYLSGLFLIWLAILFYRYNNYYAGFLRPETQVTLLYLALAYTAFGLLFYVILPYEKIPPSKTFTLIKAITRVAKDTKNYIKNFTKNPDHPIPKLEKHEKTVIFFTLVKIFFLPIMLNFFFANFFSVKSQISSVVGLSSFFSIESFNSILYPFLLASIFLVDTLYFSFGYTFEAGFLKNKIRSVEPTVFGWAVALACYPPISGIVTGYASWHANDYAIFPTTTITFIARIAVLLLLLIYLSATIALGAKCSNLTNRGIISRGPYKFIRHPAYISKNLAWWITLIPVMGIFSIFSMLAWSTIYYFRAITEERHLIKDLDYQEYCKKVKYRFIPWVY